MSEIADELRLYLRSRYPLIYIVSHEEGRVVQLLHELAEDLGKSLTLWSVARGWHQPGGRSSQRGAHGDPRDALAACAEPERPTLFVLLDFHPYLKDPTIVRQLRETVHHLITATESSLLIVSPVLEIPDEMEKETTVVEFPLPGLEEISRTVTGTLQSLGDRLEVALGEEEREELERALLGLTQTEVENALYRVIVADGKLDASDIDDVVQEKRQIIRKSGILEFYPARESMDDVGGLDVLKAWLTRKRACFHRDAEEFGLDQPKGVLLIGVPGCGKSLTAKAASSAWRMPLLRFDLGRVFGSYVGESEQNMRRAIRTAEAVAPCILWMDEIEKGFAGATGASGDSGTTQRVFGHFLTWMQEKTEPVFVVATANDIERLPPEFLRKGRFDEIFFVDLPSEPERAEIAEVHLRKRERDPAGFDLEAVAEVTEGFTGADIEEVVKAALETAYLDGRREVTDGDLLGLARATLPLSATMPERIQGLRSWAQTRAMPASRGAPAAEIASEEQFRDRRHIDL